MNASKIGAALLMAAASLTLSTSASSADTLTLRMHGYLPAGAPAMKDFFTPWAEKIKSESDGKLNVEIYPSMQLGGSPASLLDQAKDGQVDIVFVPLLYTPNRYPSSTVFELPFVAGEAEPTSRAAWDFYEKHLREDMADVHVLAMNTHGPGILHKRGGDPIKELGDLKGLKIRGPNRPLNDYFIAQDAVPVSLPGASISEALSKGVIDVGTYPWETVPALKIHELVDSHTMFDGNRALYVTLFATVMNKDKYDALPPELQKIIDANSGREASAWVGRAMGDADAGGLKTAQDYGNTVITISGDEEDRWKAAAEPIVDKWVASMNKRGVDGQQLLDDLRDSIRHYEEKMASN